MEYQKDVLYEYSISHLRKRRVLLPLWLKMFIWIFLLFGAIIPIAIVLGIMGYHFEISLYGFQTNEPVSIIGFVLMTFFLLKAIVAYGLWTEKNWGVQLGIIDAFIGLLICLFTMFVYPFISSNEDSVFNFRLEVLFLVPYLLKLLKIKKDW